MKVTQLCPTLCDFMDYTVHEIFQGRILEWVAFPFSRGSSQPRDRTQVSHIAGRFFYQLSHKGSPRILEWVAFPFSRGSSWPRNRTKVSCTAGRFFTNWAIRKPINNNSDYTYTQFKIIFCMKPFLTISGKANHFLLCILTVIVHMSILATQHCVYLYTHLLLPDVSSW